MMRNLIRRAVDVELLVLAVVAPALLFPTPARSLALLVLPVVWLGAWRAQGHFVPRTPLDLGVLGLLAMTLVSLYATPDLEDSLPKIAGLLFHVSVFYGVARWVTTRGRLELAGLAFAAAGAGLSLLGLVGTNWLVKWPALGAITGALPALIRGLPGAEEGFQPNSVAGALVLIVPVQMTLLSTSGEARLAGPLRWLLGLALGITSVTLVLTQSRGALLGLGIALWATLVWRGGWARRAGVLAAAAGILAAVLAGPARLENLLLSGGGAGLSDNAASRQELWSRALYALQDFPLTGLGLNGFRRVLPVVYPTLITPTDMDVAHAHNHLLQAGLDLGLPGLAAYLALWLVSGFILWRAHQAARDRLVRALALGLSAGLLAHFSFGLTDAIALGSKLSLLFWLALALAVSTARLATAPGEAALPSWARALPRQAGSLPDAAPDSQPDAAPAELKHVHR
jgi:putative inorganic carbon (HCO3(-)) transporter